MRRLWAQPCIAGCFCIACIHYIRRAVCYLDQLYSVAKCSSFSSPSSWSDCQRSSANYYCKCVEGKCH